MILAFDIGGTRIRAAMVEAGGLRPLGEVPTPAQEFGAFAEALRGFLGMARRVAISIAGVVDPTTGVAHVANIPCLTGRAVASDLAVALGVPVTLVNDADAFALAEARQGAGRGHAGVFGIILGTGVGGGLVLQGRLVSGAGGLVGEWGHGPMLRGPLALPCGCGRTGCLETLGGARGIERLHGLLHGTAITAPDLVRAWQAGDKAATATVGEWLAILSGPLAMLVNTLGVTCVPVGGGLGMAHPLIAALDAQVRPGVLRATDAPLLVPALLGDRAGLIGAAEATAD